MSDPRTRWRVTCPVLRHCGNVGREIKRVNDHGACAKDPLRMLRFDNDEREVFWTEEIERVDSR